MRQRHNDNKTVIEKQRREESYGQRDCEMESQRDRDSMKDRISFLAALLRGRKRWLLYPPGQPPPGISFSLSLRIAYHTPTGVRVGVAKDGGEKYIAPTPVKWLLKYYHAAVNSGNRD